MRVCDHVDYSLVVGDATPPPRGVRGQSYVCTYVGVTS